MLILNLEQTLSISGGNPMVAIGTGIGVYLGADQILSATESFNDRGN